jgi:hypothetical protein
VKNRGIFTIAIGKKYARQAKYLALSAMIHAPHVPRAVLSDQTEYLAPLFDRIIPFNGETGEIFSLKMRLHHYTPFEKTLFLDADSLIMGNIDFCWDFVAHKPFSYFGIFADSGKWYFDIKEIMKKTGAEWFLKFNSGMFLFDSSGEARDIFDTAHRYFCGGGEKAGVSPFRGTMYPDEPFFALSFVKHGLKPDDDGGRFSRTLIKASRIRINAVKGISSMYKDGRTVFPQVVHFCGRRNAPYYLREKLRLFLYFFPHFI